MIPDCSTIANPFAAPLMPPSPPKRKIACPDCHSSGHATEHIETNDGTLCRTLDTECPLCRGHRYVMVKVLGPADVNPVTTVKIEPHWSKDEIVRIPGQPLSHSTWPQDDPALLYDDPAFNL